MLNIKEQDPDKFFKIIIKIYELVAIISMIFNMYYTINSNNSKIPQINNTNNTIIINNYGYIVKSNKRQIIIFLGVCLNN